MVMVMVMVMVAIKVKVKVKSINILKPTNASQEAGKTLPASGRLSNKACQNGFSSPLDKSKNV